MANLIKMRNGTRKVANKKRRRRNPVTKVANRKRRRRNPTSASARTVIQNGIKLVSNRKRRRRNGVALVANKKRRHHKRRRNGIMSKANGLFNKTGLNKGTATAVVSLLVGLGVTKIESAILSPVVAQVLSMFGLQGYAVPLTEASMSLTVNRWAANAVKRGSGELVMYGGLAMALMDAIQIFVPSLSAYSPFVGSNTMPLVLNQPSIVSPQAYAALAAANGGQPVTAKVGAAMRPRIPMGYSRPRV